MSRAEIMEELPKLSREDRRAIWNDIGAMDGFDGAWSDDRLTPDETALIESRMDRHRRDPKSALSLEEMLARLDKRLAK